MKHMSSYYPDLKVTWNDLIKKILFEQFDLSKFVTDYEVNVMRFKVSAKKIMDAAEHLTSAYRLKWFQNNVLPRNLFYVSFTATQPDPEVVVGKKLHTDSYMLRDEYYQMVVTMGGAKLNDAQMPFEYALFHPLVHQMLNPQQKLEGAYDHYWVGPVAGTHWGISFPQAFMDPDRWSDPFPRTILAQTIANYVARIEAGLV